jgi:hypothetical protein
MRVLNYCEIPDLRNVRSAILSLACCEVVSRGSESEAIRAIYAQHFDALVLCDQTDATLSDRLCQHFRAVNPGARIILIKSLGGQLPSAQPDAVVDTLSPGALFHAMSPQDRSGSGQNAA